MLTIKDLSVSNELDHAAMTTVRGGHGPSLRITNKPTLDFSSDWVSQGAKAVSDQSGNTGGLNLSFISQYQEGNA